MKPHLYFKNRRWRCRAFDRHGRLFTTFGDVPSSAYSRMRRLLRRNNQEGKQA